MAGGSLGTNRNGRSDRVGAWGHRRGVTHPGTGTAAQELGTAGNKKKGVNVKTFKVGPMFRRYGRLSDAPKVRIGPKPGSMRSLRGERQEYILDLPCFGSPKVPLKAPDAWGPIPRYRMSRGGDPRGSSPATP